jgi:hypothetical protein
VRSDQEKAKPNRKEGENEGEKKSRKQRAPLEAVENSPQTLEE